MAIPYVLVTVALLWGPKLRVSEARRAWRDAGRCRLQPEALWRTLLGNAVVRGADRAVLAQAILLFSAAVMMGALTGSTWLPVTAAARFREVGGAAGALGIVVGTAAAVMIVLVNRPVALIPLPCRHEGGILARSGATRKAAQIVRHSG